MNLTFPAQLIRLFGRFRQLNSMINENWRDSASSSFFDSLINPINTGWSSFERETNQLLNDIGRGHRECVQLEAEMQRMFRQDPLTESNLNGCGIFRFTAKINYYTQDLHFLVAPWRMNEVLGDSDCRKWIAMEKHPGIEVLDTPSVTETVRI